MLAGNPYQDVIIFLIKLEFEYFVPILAVFMYFWIPKIMAELIKYAVTMPEDRVSLDSAYSHLGKS